MTLIPKVSICIPTFNEPDFFEYTLKSVLKQDFQNYEIIITDDSRNDAIKIVVDKYLPDPKIKYFKNEKQKGPPANWNEAITKASGEYIKILHHDDWFTEINSLSLFVKALDINPDINFCFSATQVSNSDKKLVRIHAPSKKQLTQLKKDPTILFCGNFIGAPSTTMYRRHIRDQYDQKLKWLVDLDLYIRILQKNRFKYIEEALIATTSQAAHQVTTICQNNKEIEVYEYIYLFQKIYSNTKYNLSEQLKKIFDKYNILLPKDLKFLGNNLKIDSKIIIILKPSFFKVIKLKIRDLIK